MLNAALQSVPESWFATALIAAGVLAAVLLVFQSRAQSLPWRIGAAILAILVAAIVADGLTRHDRTLARQAVEKRAGDLATQALRPGSALACLNDTGHAAVEEGCRKAIFETPEQVAAALTYVDAQLGLLEEAAARQYQATTGGGAIESVRRALAADPFGLVAHLLTSRGCTSQSCPALRMFGNPDRVIANMQAGTFDALAKRQASEWQRGAARPQDAPVAPTASIGPAGLQPKVQPQPQVAQPGAAPADGDAQRPVEYDFPSSESIPSVSIMEPEPTRREKVPLPQPRRSAP